VTLNIDGMDLGFREIQYILRIYKYIFEEGLESIGSTKLSRDIGVSPPTTVEALERLEEKGLIRYIKRKGVRLTHKGIETAREFIWRHRVMETYLCKSLGLDVDTVCIGLMGSEYRMDRRIIEKMYEKLGRPIKCPHGNPIPHGEYNG